MYIFTCTHTLVHQIYFKLLYAIFFSWWINQKKFTMQSSYFNHCFIFFCIVLNSDWILDCQFVNRFRTICDILHVFYLIVYFSHFTLVYILCLCALKKIWPNIYVLVHVFKISPTVFIQLVHVIIMFKFSPFKILCYNVLWFQMPILCWFPSTIL